MSAGLSLARWCREHGDREPPAVLVERAADEQGITEQRAVQRARSNAGQMRVPHSWAREGVRG